MTKKPLIYITFLLFAISILIRIPNIDRPLSVRYEWVTAHTLITLGIWMEEGIVEHNFNPIYTFPNPNDHHIKCPISGVSDTGGNYYYVSYPPFSFILPFLTFKLAQASITPLNLQIFNLFIHLICSVLIFLIIQRLYKDKNGDYAALAGASVYIFSTTNLWYHSNVYFADILVQLFFLSTILFYLRLTRKRQFRTTNQLLLCISVFFMVYTEWLGVLMTGVLLFHSLLSLKDRKTTLLIAASASAALLTFILQYSSVDGLENYLNTLLNRFSERSGNTNQVSLLDPAAHIKFATIYMRNFFPQFILIIFSIFLIAIFNLSPKKLHLKRPEFDALLLSLFPVIIHHYLLFQFTIVHELSLVKATVPTSLIIAFLVERLYKLTNHKELAIQRYLYNLVFISMISLSVYFYYSHIIKPDEYLSLRLGTQIKKTSSPSDTIFFKTTKTLGGFMIQAPKNFVMAPQFQYYSGRCIQVVADEIEAIEHLDKYNKEKGIIYTIENSFYKIESVRRVYNSKYNE